MQQKLKTQVEAKLNTIADIWNHFIWKYDFCKREIKFNDEIKTNYFGDILGYFLDTFPIIFDDKEAHNYSDTFSNNISLLQSIYVQQDFIEELLIIFKCGITKGDLKSDINYFLNREIRNELVGHPIRRLKGQLISSCLFGYGSNNKNIVYLKYHKDKNYEFEKVEYLISEIVLRHNNFLNTYFDKILNKLKRILKTYIKELENFKNLIEKKSFTEIIKIASIFYESIFESDYLYDIGNLEIVYKRKNEHNRYQNLIDRFYSDLTNGILETIDYVNYLIESKLVKEHKYVEQQTLEIEYIDSPQQNNVNQKPPISYNYELGKIATKRNPMDFEFFSGFLRDKCANNKIVIDELNHMQNNLYIDIEFYTAYRLICVELNED